MALTVAALDFEEAARTSDWPEFPGARAQSSLDCGDFWSHPDLPHDRHGGAFPCLEYEPAWAAGRIGPWLDLRVFYPASWETSPPPGAEALLDAIAHGLDDSVAALGGYLPTFPTYVVVSDYFARLPESDGAGETEYPHTEARAAGTWIDAGEPCPIVVFPPARRLSAPDVKQGIAHEVFHCLQAAHFGDRMDDGAALGDPPHTYPAKWWVEGTAEYFSNVVYPCNNYEHRNSASFAVELTLLRQAYANAIFFQYLSENERRGPRGIIDLIRRMPVRETWASERAALAAVPEMPRLLHGFAQALYDGNVVDCAPPIDRMPWGAAVIEQRIGPSGAATITIDPFAVNAVILVLQPGRSYRIAQRASGAPGTLSYRHATETGGWLPLPDEIITPCDPETAYYVVGTSAADSDEPYVVELSFESEPAERCGRCMDTGERDGCLVGTWDLPPDAAAEWIRTVYRRAKDATFELLELHGKARFSLDRGGNASGRLSDVRARSRMVLEAAGNRVVAIVTLKMRGSSSSTWSTDRYGRLYICPVADDFSATQTTVLDNGMSITNPIEMPGLSSDVGVHVYDYSCSAGSATISTDAPGGATGLPPQIYRFRKIHD